MNRRKSSSRKSTPKSTTRLNKYIAHAGICSRREADMHIGLGVVKVNNKIVTELGYQVQEGDVVHFDGKLITPEKKAYVLLNKPKGFITTTKDDRGRKTVMDLVSKSTPSRIVPVGRLDRPTTGLLLFTNDGDLAHQLMHPRHKVSKGYFVKVRGIVENKVLSELRKGPVIDDRRHQRVRVKILHNVNDKTWLELFLREGTNRQIKKMFKKIGHPVQKIKRFQIGSIILGDLQSGESRALSPKEIKQILN